MVQADRIKTIAVAGCTAVGKSETALRLAADFGGELIGADSMQIYRGFDIGTGKLTREECGGVIHRLIDVADGDEDFSVGKYVKLADEAINVTASAGKLPIIVGGTGMYIYSLLSGCDFANVKKDDALRIKLKVAAHFFGPAAMHELLKRVDAPSAQKIAAGDIKRTIRALEIYFLTGTPKSAATGHVEPRYDSLVIVLILPREELYARINARVAKMFDDGLMTEAKKLAEKYSGCGSMQALGYKQIAENPDAGRAEIEPIVAQKTRNYAKRQMTYFNNMKLNKIFIDAHDYGAIKAAVGGFLGEKHE